MDASVTSLFETGYERYKAGESPQTLIPVFKEVCERAPKNAAAWICLSWLYLLDARPTEAYKAAQKAVKLNPQDPQAHVNLAAAMLETKQAGVRQHIEVVQQILAVDSELRQDIQVNLEEGLSRKPDWNSLKRIQTWLFGS